MPVADEPDDAHDERELLDRRQPLAQIRFGVHQWAS
jgi:hypothetical protein